jgi:hypothetical protein
LHQTDLKNKWAAVFNSFAKYTAKTPSGESLPGFFKECKKRLKMKYCIKFSISHVKDMGNQENAIDSILC